MLRIFKGDDTDFADANRLRITIGTTVVLAGCRAEFSFLGVTRHIPDASTGTFEVAFTAAETAAMPLGVHCATIRVFDAQGRQRTTTNTLRIEVTDNVDMAYSGENAADVDGHLVVKGVVDDGYGVPADLPEDYTPDEMRAFLNRLAALLRNSMPVAATLLTLAFAPAMGAEVEYARFGSIKATTNVVTNVDLSAKADATNVYTKTETDARIMELAPVPDISGKQDTLPYPTNEIPFSAIDGVPAETDPTVPAWAKSPTPPASGITTNDVCAIVTNEVATGWSKWAWTDGGDWGTPYYDDGVGEWLCDSMNGAVEGTTDINATSITYFLWDAELEQDLHHTATRTRLTRNALGLARLVDLPQLTNDVPYMISSAAQAAISTNNPAFITAVTNCPVVIATMDGTTLGEFGEYGTLGALLAALAAAITWLKTNKADASSLPYALVTVTPTAGTPFVLAACFPITYTDNGSTVTITAADAGDLSVDWDEGDDCYYVSYSTSRIFVAFRNGEFSSSIANGLEFNDTDPEAMSWSQALGFTPTYTLADRTTNRVTLASPLPENGIALAFPAPVDGKVRDFLLRLEIPAGDAPQIAYPEGVTFENADGEFPEIAADENAACATLLMFTETRAATTGAGATPACFLVKGEQLKGVST